MALDPDSFDVAYSEELRQRVARLEEEEERDIRTRLEMERKAARKKAMMEQQAQEQQAFEAAGSGEEPVDAARAPEPPGPAQAPQLDEQGMPVEQSEDNVEGSFIGDALTGFLGGVRDAGVNIAQTVFDLGGLVDSGLKFDEYLPEVEQRDSGVHAFTRATTQFLTGFVPVLGTMKWAGGVNKISKLLSNVRTSTLGTAATGSIATYTVAGAASDFSVFNPFEARFSDMVQDMGFDNPITAYLASDENDSALEGRIKNVIEGATLGLFADGLMNSVRASKALHLQYLRMIEADVPREVANQFEIVHQGVVWARQNLDEATKQVDEWKRLTTPATDAAADEARAGGEALSKEAADLAEAAEFTGKTVDEVAEPLDRVAAADSPIEQIRTQDPDMAAKLEDAGVHTLDELEAALTARREELVEAETAFMMLPASEAWKHPKTRALRHDYAKQLEDFQKTAPPELLAEIEAAQARASGELDMVPPAARVAEKGTVENLDEAIETKAKGMGADADPRDTGPLATSPEELEARAKAAIDNPVDVIADKEALDRYFAARKSEGVYNHARKAIDTTDPIVAKLLVKIFATNRSGLSDPAMKSIGQLMGLNNYNTRRLSTAQGMRELGDELHTVFEAMSPTPKRTDKQVRRAAKRQAEQIARELGDEDRADAIFDAFSTWFGNVKNMDRRIQVIRIMEISTMQHASGLVDDIIAGGINGTGSATKSDLALAFKNFVNFANLRDGLATEVGRGLRAFGQMVEPKLLDTAAKAEGRQAKAAAFERIIKSIGGDVGVQQLAGLLKPVLNDPKALNKFIRAAEGEGLDFFKIGQEFWLNAILSGPITQTVNLMSNTLVALWTPAEKGIQGALTGDKKMIMGAIKEYQGMAEGFRAAFRIADVAREDVFHSLGDMMGGMIGMKRGENAQLRAQIKLGRHKEGDVGHVWKALFGGEPSLISNSKIFDTGEAALTSQRFGLTMRSRSKRTFDSNIEPLEGQTFGGRAVDALGTVIRMPSRLLTTGDELAKSINYHMALNRLGYENAIAKGIPADQFDTYIKKFVQDVPTHRYDPMMDEGLRAEFASFEAQAIEQAKINTFTMDLPHNSLGESVQNLTNAVPFMKFFIPFVRTPVNLLKFGTERTPGLALASRRYRDLSKLAKEAGKRPMNAEGKKAIADFAAAKSRMWIGTGIMSGIGIAAFEGKLTGTGPTNPQERAVLLATGWKPNSIKWDNGDGTFDYISYNRMDPVGMILGIATQFGEMVGQMSDEDASVNGAALLFGLSDLLQSKSYYQGLTGIVQALARPDVEAKRYLQRFIGSWVPNAVASTNRTGVVGGYVLPAIPADHVLRELTGWFDGIQSKMPGFSADLPPRRNIFGEIITYDMGVGPDSVSPFQSHTSRDDKVNKELQRLVQNHGFGMNMNLFRTIGNIELTPEQKDAYITLATGDPHRNGTDFRADLHKLFRSKAYKNADDGEFGKQELIHNLFRKRTQRARKLLKQRDPQLRTAILEERRLRTQAQRRKVAKREQAEGRRDTLAGIMTQLTAPTDKLT